MNVVFGHKGFIEILRFVLCRAETSSNLIKVEVLGIRARVYAVKRRLALVVSLDVVLPDANLVVLEVEVRLHYKSVVATSARLLRQIDSELIGLLFFAI